MKGNPEDIAVMEMLAESLDAQGSQDKLRREVAGCR